MDFDPIPDNDDPDFVFTPLSRALAAIIITTAAFVIINLNYVLWVATDGPALTRYILGGLFLAVIYAIYKILRKMGV